ncbi:DEAD/DEAH box helicase [archaeon]|nr:DEAD/DEAH box helicase [archaeon]
MQYVENPWINNNTIEHRTYQNDIVKSAVQKNTLCVIPTGLGKTSIAALVAVNRLEKFKNSKIMFLAPTRPLVSQHKNTFEKFLKLGLELCVVTGEDDPDVRANLYKESDIIFSTPQTVRNDIKEGRISLADFSLCIFDEAHRCVGSYAYTYIAKNYIRTAKNPLILALTASPGSHKYKIDDVKKNLFIDAVEIKSRDDVDVKPYVQSVTQEWIEVELPESMKTIRKYLDESKGRTLKKLIDLKILHSPYTTKSQLLKLQQELARKKKGYAFMAMSLIAEIIKLDHALLLLETQSLTSLKSYLVDLKKDGSRAVARLLNDKNFNDAVRLTNELIDEGKEHPKLESLRLLVEKILNEFRMGFYNILCASQVAEEGLDVVETDMVIFYEPVPSAIRKIQRSGRTARTRAGRVIVLITKNTRDETYYWVAHNKEKKMTKILTDMKRKTDVQDERHVHDQKSMGDFNG